MLAGARILILTVPFKYLASWLRRAPETEICDDETLRQVRRAVMTAARHVPWNAVCLPQAMAAKAMLARRGYGSAFHLGAGIQPERGLMAHAWLTVNDKFVVGEGGMSGVTPLIRLG